MTRRSLTYAGLTFSLVAGLLLLAVGLPRWLASSSPGETGTSSETAGTASRRIRARLFFVAQDGMHLMSVEREVLFGEGTVEQAKRILEAQLGPAPAPLATAIPAGTKLRAIYLTERGEAYVDLSVEAGSAHSGGTMNEILTVYTIVNALTVNLPAISGVQLLIDGKEVDTLAGHVDLRRPLQQNLGWVAESQPLNDR